MKKRIFILVMLLLILFINISFALFTSIDRSINNYINIGKIRKEEEEEITGTIYKYSKVQKNKLQVNNEWINRVSVTALSKLLDLNQHFYPVSIRNVSILDTYGFSADYVLALHTKSIKTKETVVDTTYLIIEVIADSHISTYRYNYLNKKDTKKFEYSQTDRTISETNNNKVSCLAIDLSSLLQSYIDSKTILIKVKTPHGTKQFKIR